MNGAEHLLATALASGIDVCFANPGTSEMQLVAALDAAPQMRSILCLFEGVCSGAADGYARMTGKPALTVLHLGPGFANGIANFHNAFRADTPMVNLIGNNPTWHLAHPAPLSTDIESLARPVSHWVSMATSVDDLADKMKAALETAQTPPGKIASLIVPQDCAWSDTERPPVAVSPVSPSPVDDSLIVEAAELLSRGASSLLLIGGSALSRRGQRAAARIGEKTGCQVMLETFAARLERGADTPLLAQVPYFPEQALPLLEGIETAVLAGTRPPVAFFGYPGMPSEYLPPSSHRMNLGDLGADLEAALEEVAARVGAAPEWKPPRPTGSPPDALQGDINSATIGAALAAVQPDDAIVVLESVTSGFQYGQQSAQAPPHTTLRITGGSIGFGLPCAVGAAVACPDRKVIAFQADGSAMYTLQALWTMVRESLDVTILVCANRTYEILRVELARAGVEDPGAAALSLTDLAHPTLDFVQLAQGMGVPATRVDTLEALVDALRRAIAEPGPQLVEAVMVPMDSRAVGV